uniref:coilin n=1 Tax=Erigeron canadensis TaxID=72917 RepID=UPI001CB8FBBE|nr:coilin [Erigeron canadensis]
MPSLRIRVAFEDPSVLTQTQRSQGMSNSWILIEPIQQLPKISDVCNHIFHMFSLHTSCPNGILLFMEGFVLPPSESARILKDNDIICVKRKGVALGEVIEGAVTCNLLELNGMEPVENGVLLLANEEFDKETGGYQSDSEDAEEEKLEVEPSPKDKASKKRKVSPKLHSSKKKRKRSLMTDGVEDEVATEDGNSNKDECLPTKNIRKKSKPNQEKKSAGSETITVKGTSKVKRKKKQGLGVVNDAEDEVMIDEFVKVNNREEVRQESAAPDVAKKVPSRSARRKKVKRQWRRELAKNSQNPDTHLEPEIVKAENKEANGHPDELLKQDQVPAKLVDKNIIKQEESNGNGNMDTELVPRVVRPGHIRFEHLDQDEDAREIEVPNVPFQWNGITSKKKGQKWGIEKFSTSQQDESQIATKGPSTKLPEDTSVPLVGFSDFDHLPLCSSPKEDDVIAYRLLELSSSWTPELSSFRVGKISHYNGNVIVLKPVPEYPIVVDKTDEDEDGPDNSLYKEDGSLETKFEALVDVRSFKRSNSDARIAVANGVNPNPQGDDKDVASKLLSISNNNKTHLPKDPNQEVMNKEGNTWDELKQALIAKKAELQGMNAEMKKDSGRNKWSYRALRGSALGPTMAMLRSSNNI